MKCDDKKLGDINLFLEKIKNKTLSVLTFHLALVSFDLTVASTWIASKTVERVGLN